MSINQLSTCLGIVLFLDTECSLCLPCSGKILIFALYIFFSSEITSKYFDQLPAEDIIKLYYVYEDDFKLFDYDFDIFIKNIKRLF